MTNREAGVLRDTGCREVLGDEWVVLWLVVLAEDEVMAATDL